MRLGGVGEQKFSPGAGNQQMTDKKYSAVFPSISITKLYLLRLISDLICISINMRKRITFRQLGMKSSHRWAMLRNMVTSLIKHERIMTTTQKAKELRRVADKMVTHAKKGNLVHKRKAGAVVREQVAMIKLFEILGPRYKYVIKVF